MKKIAYLMEYPIDLPGGAQMSTLAICEGLAKHPEYGYEPVVICPALLNTKKENYPFEIREYPMGENRIINFLIRLRSFLEILKNTAPDLIHIEMQESLITYGFIRKSFRDIPYVFTERGLMYGYRKRSRIFMDPVLHDARMMVTTTEYNKKLWTENSDIRPITVIPNTISGKYFGEYDPAKPSDTSEKRKDEGSEQLEEFKQRENHKHLGNKAAEGKVADREIPTEKKKTVIGLAGRICVEKDWPFACDLIETLAQSGLEFKVKIVLSTFEKGDDDQVNIILKRISKAVGAENLESHLNYNQQEMADFYYGVDIFLMTSRFESFGKAAVEAMSRKCAVVSTAVGGLPEVIGLKENLYTKDEMDNGVDIIRSLINDKEKLARQKEYFYQRYKDNYTEDKYIERHVRLYDEFT